MNKTDMEEIITYRDCIKDGIIVAFVIHSIIGQILFSSSPVFALFLLLTIITALVIYTPIILLIKSRIVV